MASPDPHGVDLRIGRTIRARRHILGLTQGELGQRLGITHQQINKYEAGRSQISVRMLCRMADALGESPADLLEAGTDHRGASAEGADPPGDVEVGADCRRDTLEMVRLYLSLPDERSRRAFLQLGRAIANATGSGDQVETASVLGTRV